MKPAQSDGQAWLTPEVRALLRAIPGPHHEKKVVTVIRIAFAMANQEPIKAVFNQPETCAENIWYQKWRHDPTIAAALAATYQRARDYADEETIRQEEFHRRERKRATARYAAQAPAALAAVMAGADQRGSDRINAAVTLIKLAEPETAGSVGTVAALSMEQIAVMAQLSNDELLRVAMGENLETIRAGRGGGAPGGSDAGAGSGHAGAAPAGSTDSGGDAGTV